jgi:hypothetical protein
VYTYIHACMQTVYEDDVVLAFKDISPQAPTHTHTYTHIHTCRLYTKTMWCSPSRTSAPKHLHTHIYTHIHTYIHTYIHADLRRRCGARLQRHQPIRTHTPTYIHTYIHTYTQIVYEDDVVLAFKDISPQAHTHTHTHTYAHMHTCRLYTKTMW